MLQKWDQRGKCNYWRFMCLGGDKCREKQRDQGRRAGQPWAAVTHIV